MMHNMSDKLHLNAGRPENHGSIPSRSVQIGCAANQASYSTETGDYFLRSKTDMA
jgi:hypothetical protein